MRYCSTIFIRYKSNTTDQVVSKIIHINRVDIPTSLKTEYQKNRDMKTFISWLVNDNDIDILTISTLNDLEDLLVAI